MARRIVVEEWCGPECELPDGGVHSSHVLDPGELVDLIDTHTQAIIDGLGIENLVVAPGASVLLDLGLD